MSKTQIGLPVADVSLISWLFFFFIVGRGNASLKYLDKAHTILLLNALYSYTIYIFTTFFFLLLLTLFNFIYHVKL